MLKNMKLLRTLQNKVTDINQNVDVNVFTSNHKPNSVQPTSTYGYSIQLGKFKSMNADFEIWIDEYTGEQKLWYGLVFGYKPDRYIDFVHTFSSRHNKPRLYSLDDLIPNKQTGKLSYILPLQTSEIGLVVFENYNNIWFLGMYDNIPNSMQQINKTVKRIRDLIEKYHATDVHLNPKEYEGFENRIAVREHLYRERNSKVAQDRKKADLYICQICGFNFEKSYGKYGKNFAESHHIVPLSSSNEIRQTRLEDLITVCSNCHRMLHRMKGEKGDIENLKKTVIKRRMI